MMQKKELIIYMLDNETFDSEFSIRNILSGEKMSNLSLQQEFRSLEIENMRELLRKIPNIHNGGSHIVSEKFLVESLEV